MTNSINVQLFAIAGPVKFKIMNQRSTIEFDKCLVMAVHPPRLTAGKNNGADQFERPERHQSSKASSGK